MRARHPERRFLAYFFAAVGKEVRRQQANLEIPAQDFGYTCMKLPARARRNDDSILFL